MHDEDFMRMAIHLATENVQNQRGGPFGAVVVQDGKVIATGVNQVTASNDPTAHAEVMALRNACKSLNKFELSGATLYSSCEPCPMCLAAILWARCSRLCYAATAADAASAGFDDSYFYEQIRLSADKRALPAENLLRDEAWASFTAWNQHAGKIRY